MVKNLPLKAGDVGSVPGLERSPVEGNGHQASILAWRSPWTEEPGWSPWGHKKVGHDFAMKTTTYCWPFSIEVLLLRYYIHVFGKTCWYGKHVVTVVRTCIKSLVGATRTPTDTSFVIVREFKS